MLVNAVADLQTADVAIGVDVFAQNETLQRSALSGRNSRKDELLSI
jgi:hypothetical protein